MYFLLNITQVIFDAMRSLCLFLDIIIYDMIVLMYGIFEKLAVAEFLSNEAIQDIYRKGGVILGLYMVFRLTFSLIKMLIDPDLVADKEKGVYNIIKRIIISVLLMAVTPFIFNEAFKKSLLNGSFFIITSFLLTWVFIIFINKSSFLFSKTGP